MKKEIAIFYIIQQISLNYGCNKTYVGNCDITDEFCLETFKRCPVPKNCIIINKENLSFSLMDKKVILDRFNTYRHQVALGFYDNPPAKNMRELVWNEHLAFLAQCETNKCNVKETAVRTGNKNISQNKILIPQTYLNRGRLVILQIAVDAWFQAISTFTLNEDFIRNPSNPDRIKNKHFVKIIWGESAEVGCGRTIFSKDGNTVIYIICNFKKIDSRKKHIYDIGEPCSMCPDVEHKKGECHDVTEGLCRTDYFVPPPDPFDISNAHKEWPRKFALFLCLMIAINIRIT